MRLAEDPPRPQQCLINFVLTWAVVQPTIRPTRRARARTLPSLTHPFQEIPNPAREALLASEQQPSFAGIPFDFGGLGGMGGRMGDFTMPFPGGQMHLQMSMEQVVVSYYNDMLWHMELLMAFFGIPVSITLCVDRLSLSLLNMSVKYEACSSVASLQ